MKFFFCFERNFEALLPSRSEFEEKAPPIEADVAIYTDGSKTDEGTGAGACSEELDFSISLPLGSYVTVFQSEIIAICESFARDAEHGSDRKENFDLHRISVVSQNIVWSSSPVFHCVARSVE